MKRLVSGRVLVLWAVYIATGFCKGEFLFDDKLLLFSSDTNNKILIDRKLAYGFKTNQKVYDEGWVDGLKKRWIRSEKEIELSSVGMVSVPSDHFRNLETFFGLASISKYAEHLQMPLERFVDILWAWLYFRMEPDSLVLPEYAGGFRITTKISCFKENLYFLLRNTPLLRKEVHSILSEVRKIPQTKRHTPPSLHSTAHDRVVWFLRQPENKEIRMFLELCVCSASSDSFIYAEFIDDAEKEDSVRLVLKDRTMRSRIERSLSPFSEFITRNTVQKVQNIDIVIEGESVLSESTFNSIFVVFSSVENLSLDHPEGHVHIEECILLLTNFLKSEENRIKLGVPPLIKGILLSHTLFLSSKNISYLENANLHKFGFKSYYPAAYPSEKAYKKIKPYIDRFLDRLFLGDINLSHELRHLVAPETFYFSQSIRSGFLTNLSTVEIHVQNEAWQTTQIREYFNMSTTRGISTVILVESSEGHVNRSLRVFKGLSALENITFLDLTKTSISSQSVIEVLRDARTRYRHKLNTLSFTYHLNITPSRTYMPLHTLSISLPNITNYTIAIEYANEDALLPSLIKDIRSTLSRSPSALNHLGINLSLRTIRKTQTKYSSVYKLTPYTPNKELFKSAYQSGHTASSAGPTLYELMRIFDVAAKSLPTNYHGKSHNK